MPGFDDDDLDREDTKLPYIYEGTVVRRDDPEELGRVKVAIPGLVEPSSPWAWPAGTGGGGTKDTGLFAVPEEGGEVYVFFVGGDVDEPRYFCGHWGVTEGGSEVPEEAQKNPPDNRVLATPTFRVEMDESEGDKKLRLTNRKTGDFVELNAEDNTITIRATTGITVQATGIVDIRGTILQLNGRTVLPTGKAI